MKTLSSACVALLILSSGVVFGATSLATQIVASGFDKPVFATAPAGDTTRLFVIEQHSGSIKILNLGDGSVLPAPFLQIGNVSTGSEQGLLGLAFHPSFSTNGFFFVNYTNAAGDTVIDRFTATAGSNVADPNSRLQILTVAQPESNHNGGWLGFGTDGFLYIALGDGGGGNDQHGTIGNAQDRNSLLGKILRIDVNSGSPYSIPDGNPFKGDATKREEIWAFGLRNPYRSSIDRATNDLWIGDVGQNTREEVNFNSAGNGGLNFGWRPREGLIQNPAYSGETPVTAATDPVYDYPRSDGISVIGGYVYRGSAIPDLAGTYFFGDFGSARIWSFRFASGAMTEFQERTAELNADVTAIQNISSFAEDAVGELYVIDYSAGSLRKVIAAGTSGGATLSLTVNKLRGKLSFKNTDRDQVSVSGTLGTLPAGHNPSGKIVSVNVGGAAEAFTLNDKGRGKTGVSTFSLSLKPKRRNAQTGKPEFAGGIVAFKSILKKGTFSDDWTDEGINRAATIIDQPIKFIVVVTLDGTELRTESNTVYRGKAERSGSFKEEKK
jgi:glucose/arabinose dehydrogenase